MLLTGFTIKLQYRGNSSKVKIFLTIQRHSSKSPKYFNEISFCSVLTSGTAAFTFSTYERMALFTLHGVLPLSSYMSHHL